MKLLKNHDLLKNIIIPIAILVVSAICGFFSNDLLLGGTTLALGFLTAYYMALGNWFNYVVGILFDIIYAYVCYVNGLFGYAIFTLAVYIPISVVGFYAWFKKNKLETVIARSLNFKTGLLLCISIFAVSILIGYLLSLIPGQNLPFLDSTSQIINVGAFVLIALRYRESWVVWLANNIVDLIIWIIKLTEGSPSSVMMVITSVMFLAMNVYGYISWIILENKQKTEQLLNSISNKKKSENEKLEK